MEFNSFKLFYKTNILSNNTISAYEYWFDNDYGSAIHGIPLQRKAISN